MKKLTFAFLLLLNYAGFSQSGYQAGAMVENFATPTVLNSATTPASFQDLKGKITILDFFGTWCVPCIKALPHLAELQSKFSGAVRVLLVSVEEEAKLNSFIKKQKGFTLPVIVDTGNVITGLFQPPSYPYTVIVSGAGNVLAVTEAMAINADKINQWLKEAGEPVATVAASKNEMQNTPAKYGVQKSANAAVRLSQDFMYAARTGDETVEQLADELQKLDYNWLVTNLKTDAAKKAFWINLYNGYVQKQLRKNPEKYQSRRAFFSAKQISVAGKIFSLDAIEHGLLRKSKIKWSLGHLDKLFVGKTEKELRVSELDYRIHFALNCGAKSCPPIAYYSPEAIDSQLDLATKAYLGSDVAYDATKNSVQVPAILSWFRADFGGKKGIRSLLQRNGVVPSGATPKIKFKKYDWTLYLNNYKNEDA